MIKSVTVTNYLGDSLTMELARPEPSGFAIESITGLGPGKATINTAERSTIDGALFNSARLPSRNIVISIIYLWKNTIEDARQLSYRYFPLKKPVKLTIETDNRIAEIEGYVESNDPDIFSKQEKTDISIVCPDPFFYSNRNATTVFSGIEPLFEFQFSNESLETPLLEMSAIRNRQENVVTYEGDADVGVVITIHAVGEASGITIYNLNTRGTMVIDTDKLELIIGSGIKFGDDIIISTVKGNKYAMFQREGVQTNILNCLDRNSEWFQLTKGDNLFAYTAETGNENLQFKIENRIAYEGV